MKILVCARGYNSGSENKFGNFELDQAKSLRAAGCDVRIASLDLRSPKSRRPHGAKLFASHGMHCVTVNSFSSMLPGGLSGRYASKAAAEALHWICNDGWQPDVIHAHFTEIASAFADAAAQSSAKFVVTEHSSLMNTPSPDAKNLALARNAYLKADKVIAVSNALAQNIKKSTGVTPAVIGNVVDTNVFDSVSSGGNEPFRFVSCGNLVEGKQFDLLLKAFAKVHSDTALLNIFGDGVKRNELLHLCRSLGVSGRVSFRGHQSREVIAQEYARSDAFVLASRSETFGVSFIEAMCSGLPVISTECGGPQDIVNEHNGILVPVGDADALAKAMDKMMLTAISYHRRRIRSYAVENFSPKGIAYKLIKLYKSI